MTSMTEEIVIGAGGLPKVALAADDGAQADIYLHGAHVTSWRPAAGTTSRLFLSPHAEFRSDAAIRGGVPVIFPQFSNLGPLPRHGFARTANWSLESIERGARAAATFQLRSSKETLAIWPHHFEATLVVSIGGTQLDLQLSVSNTDEKPFSFTCALHTYLQVDSILTTTIEGLAGVRYRDLTTGAADLVEHAAELQLQGETDRIYLDVPRPMLVREPGRCTTVAMSGFRDVVIWNPWVEKSTASADLGTESYRRMLCVEAAAIGTPLTLKPRHHWSGRQTLTVQRR